MIGPASLNSMISEAMRADANRRSGQNGRQQAYSPSPGGVSQPPSAMPVPAIKGMRPMPQGPSSAIPVPAIKGMQSEYRQKQAMPSTISVGDAANGINYPSMFPNPAEMGRSVQRGSQPVSPQPPTPGSPAAGGAAPSFLTTPEERAEYAGLTPEKQKQVQAAMEQYEAQKSRMQAGLEGFKEAREGMFKGENDAAIANRKRRDTIAGEMREMRKRLQDQANAETTGGYARMVDEQLQNADPRTGQEVLEDSAQASRTGYNAMQGYGAADSVSMRDGRAVPQAAVSDGATPNNWRWQPVTDVPAKAGGGTFGGDSYTAAEQLVNANPQAYIGPNLDGTDRESAIQAVADRIGDSRTRYGGNPAGTVPIKDDYVSLINARQDLSPEQKQAFVDRYYARREARGASVNKARVGPNYDQAVANEQGKRQENIDRMNMRNEWFASRRRDRMQAAQQQQQMMMMDMLTRSAAMGNPEAARALQAIGQNQIAAMNAQTARMDAMSGSEYRQQMAMYKDREDQRAAEMQALDKQLATAKSQAEIDLINAKKAQLEKEQAEDDGKLNKQDVEGIADSLMPELGPQGAVATANAMAADGRLAARMKDGDEQAKNLYSLPGSDRDLTQMAPLEKVRDIFGRMERAYGYFRPGSKELSKDNVRDQLLREGVSQADIVLAYEGMLAEGPPGGFLFGPSREDAYRRNVQLNMLRSLLPDGYKGRATRRPNPISDWPMAPGA